MTANPIVMPLARQNLTPDRARGLAELFSGNLNIGNHTDVSDKTQEAFTKSFMVQSLVPKDLIVKILKKKSAELKSKGIHSVISELHDEVVLEWYQDGARCAFSVWPDDCDALYVSHKNGECLAQKYFGNFLNSSILEEIS